MTKRAKKQDPRDLPYTCVACGEPRTPIVYRDRPTNFHEDVIKAGHAPPGPHCRNCANKILNASVARSREASFKREELRQLSFRIPKPDHFDERQWDIVKTYACCPKARFSPCVCMYSFTCPDHGGTHVGTHD